MAIAHLDVLITKNNNRKVVRTIEDQTFWEALDIFVNILKPYEFIIKILESEHANLGHVVASWAWLRGTIEKIPSNIDSIKINLEQEIEKRWKKIYDPIFLVTWYLHPFHHGDGINPIHTLRIQEFAYNLFCSLYPELDDDQFVDEWHNYLYKESYFKSNSLWQPSITKNPNRFWKSVLALCPNLSVFASRLFAIPPNSATSERIWSLFGNIHTERRNRLKPERVVKLAKIGWYINQTNDKNKQKQDSKKIFDEPTIVMDEDNNDIQESIDDDQVVDELYNEFQNDSTFLTDDVYTVDNGGNGDNDAVPKLKEIFDFELVEKSLKDGIQTILGPMYF
jgi:hypothetical protein